MNLCILSVGSQGDVQPFVALGVGLKRAGFEVTLATAKHFEPSVQGHGLHYASGVRPPPISRRKLTVEALREAIQLATGDGEMRRRAAALSEKIRTEDGVARAVEVIARRLETPKANTW